MSGKNARLSHKSVEWYTPSWLVERSRAVLGKIWLDPCSSPEANEIIKADEFWFAEGLERAWRADTIFLNPPGKSPGNPQGAAPWWAKLVYTLARGDMRAGIYVGFSLEQLQVLQNQTGVCPLEFMTCIPKKRISFVSPDGAARSPTHANFITLLTHDKRIEASFADIFASVGHVTHV